MRKKITLFFVIILCLSVSGIACAAPVNPFSDVPLESWTYNAINQLVKVGIIEGYDDRSFKGNKPITRNEMAAIVEKAIARSDKADAETKSIIDKLQAEFATELANQGLRINNIEKKLDKLKIYGDTYIKYTHNQSNHNGKTTLTTQIPTGTRLYVNGAIDDQWSYNVRYQTLIDLIIRHKVRMT